MLIELHFLFYDLRTCFLKLEIIKARVRLTLRLEGKVLKSVLSYSVAEHMLTVR